MKLTTILVLTTCILRGGLRHVIASPVPVPQGGSREFALDREPPTFHLARVSAPDSSLPNLPSVNPNSDFAKLSTAELKALYRQDLTGTKELPTRDEREELRNRLIAAKDDNSDLETMTTAELEQELRRINGVYYHDKILGDSRAYPGETADSLLERREVVYELLAMKKLEGQKGR